MVSGYAIATLVVFILSTFFVIRPVSLPTPRPIPRIPLNLTTTPILAIALLWAAQCLDPAVIRNGIVGTEGVKPYNILILFFSLAYMAVTLDITGVLQATAFWISNKGSHNGWKLYLYFYVMFTLFSILLGNDPVILSGTALLVYFTQVAELDPRAWIMAEFAIANTASMVLFVGNPTNVIICEGFSVDNAAFTAYTILPFLACNLSCFAALAFQFRNQLPRRLCRLVHHDPRSALLDPVGAWFGSFLLGSALILCLIASSFGMDVWVISLPFAAVKFLFDLGWDYYRYTRGIPMLGRGLEWREHMEDARSLSFPIDEEASVTSCLKATTFESDVEVRPHRTPDPEGKTEMQAVGLGTGIPKLHRPSHSSPINVCRKLPARATEEEFDESAVLVHPKSAADTHLPSHSSSSDMRRESPKTAGDGGLVAAAVESREHKEDIPPSSRSSPTDVRGGSLETGGEEQLVESPKVESHEHMEDTPPSSRPSLTDVRRESPEFMEEEGPIEHAEVERHTHVEDPPSSSHSSPTDVRRVPSESAEDKGVVIDRDEDTENNPALFLHPSPSAVEGELSVFAEEAGLDKRSLVESHKPTQDLHASSRLSPSDVQHGSPEFVGVEGLDKRTATESREHKEDPHLSFPASHCDLQPKLPESAGKEGLDRDAVVTSGKHMEDAFTSSQHTPTNAELPSFPPNEETAVGLGPKTTVFESKTRRQTIYLEGETKMPQVFRWQQSYMDDLHRRLDQHFPTFITALPRLPFALLPFVFSQFILIEALNHQGWVNMFANWLVRASQKQMQPTIWLIGVLGVILCNLSGTQIGATILLTKIVRAAALPRDTDRAAAVALAVASNIGAVSFTFSASLSGLLWRAILEQKGIHVKQREFGFWNLLPLLVMMAVGFGTVSAEMGILFRS